MCKIDGQLIDIERTNQFCINRVNYSFSMRTTSSFSGPRLQDCKWFRMLSGSTDKGEERKGVERRKGERRVKKEKEYRSVVPLGSISPVNFISSMCYRQTHMYLHNTHTRNFQDRGYDRVILSTLGDS